MSILKRNALAIVGMLILAVLYLMTFPSTVQSGDTGELITNSFFLRVSHPPGYPLFHLLYHLPLKYFPVSTVFGRGAILTILITLSWMGLLLNAYRGVLPLLLILVTGTSLIFWRYAVLPDVFALHLLFLTLVYLAFLKPEKLRSPWAALAISLGVAHHHTILFVFPLYVYAFLQGERKRVLILSLLAGLISFSLYFLLMLYHPENFYSWGEMKSPMDVIHHFLRSDYGTFKLSSHKQEDHSWVNLFQQNFVRDFWSFFVLGGFLVWKNYRSFRLTKNSLILFCVVFYLGAFVLGGAISLDLAGQGVFERFLLQPILLLVFYLLIHLRDAAVPKWLLVLLLINTGLNIGRNWEQNNFRRNTLVEDYAVNVLQSLPEKSIFYPQGDTEGFATYYVREILNGRKDVFLLHPVGTDGWAGEKLSRHYPEIFHKKSDVMLENFDLDRHIFFSNKLMTILPTFTEISYYGLVYRYQKSAIEMPEAGHNCEVIHQYKWRRIPELKDYAEFDYGSLLYQNQSNCLFDRALNALKRGENSEASEILARALMMTPFSVRILERSCYVYGLLGDPRKSGCEKKLDELLLSESQQYYLYQF